MAIEFPIAEERRRREAIARDEWVVGSQRAKKRWRILLWLLPAVAAVVGAVFAVFLFVIPSLYYSSAEKKLNAERFEAAYVDFRMAGDFRDSTARADAILEAHPAVAQPGDTVVFGRYEQDNSKENGADPIVWTVLAKDGNNALLISANCLDCKPYNTEFTTQVWETCTLRKWLNEDFFKAAFTADEQKSILTVPVQNPVNPQYNIPAGGETADKVFVLSLDEAQRYFKNDDARKGPLTKYITEGGIMQTPLTEARWWLRTPGSTDTFAAYVNVDGTLFTFGEYVHSTLVGVRPCISLTLPE